MTQVFDNVQDIHFNNLIINNLKESSNWKLANDYSDYNVKFDLDKFSDNGFILSSYDEALQISKEPFFNVSAYHIFVKVLTLANLNLNDYVPVRYLWNYYNRASTGISHTDDYHYNQNFKHYSIVYYLKKSDGGTVINGNFFEDTPGRAVLFDSNTYHYGVGPKQYSDRFLLNIMYRTKNENRT